MKMTKIKLHEPLTKEAALVGKAMTTWSDYMLKNEYYGKQRKLLVKG